MSITFVATPEQRLNRAAQIEAAVGIPGLAAAMAVDGWHIESAGGDTVTLTLTIKTHITATQAWNIIDGLPLTDETTA